MVALVTAYPKFRISGVKVFLRAAQGKPLPNRVKVSRPCHVFSFAVSIQQTALGAAKSPAEKRAHDCSQESKDSRTFGMAPRHQLPTLRESLKCGLACNPCPSGYEI